MRCNYESHCPPMPNCPRIFITERGMKAHERKCKYRRSCKTCKFYQFERDYGRIEHDCSHDEAINIQQIGCQYDCKFYEMRQNHKEIMGKAKYAPPLEAQS